jgi:UDP-glucuronate decarboxylase
MWGNVNPIGPRSCYDEGKRAAETLCYIYRNTYNVDVGLVRIFNTYGPHMDPDDGRVVTNFIKSLILDQPITIYGDGKQTRSFCYVSDLCDGLFAMGQLRDEFGPINIGNDQEFDMLQLANLVSGIKGVKPWIEHRSLPVNDPLQRKPDLTLAKKLLNYNPKVTLEEGLRYTYEYMLGIV